MKEFLLTKQLSISRVWVSKMKITEYKIKCPIECSLRAAFVADTHDKPYARIIEEIIKRNVDMILMTGDIIYAHDDVADNGFQMLFDFAALAPTFMSLGNHEGGAVKVVREKCAKAGVSLLEDEFVDFYGIKIGGLTSGYIVDGVGIPESHWKNTPAPNLDWLNKFAEKDGYKLLLNHHPEYYPKYIKSLDIDLTLSGHAHGGQWRLFGIGLFAPGQGLFPKYTSGMHDGRLIISRGLANNAPPIPRLFNSKELIFIDFINE